MRRRFQRSGWVGRLAAALSITGPGVCAPVPYDDTPKRLEAPAGQTHALVIGVDDYAHTGGVFGPLTHPRTDARVLGELFSDRFGYEVRVLENPTADEIRAVLDHYAETVLAPEDALLVTFSGHGSNVRSAVGVIPQTQGYFITRIEAEPEYAAPQGPKRPADRVAIAALTIDHVRPALLEAEPRPEPPAEDDPDELKRHDAALESWAAGRIQAERHRRVHDLSLPMAEVRDFLTGLDVRHAVGIFDACHAGLATRSGGAPAAVDTERGARLIRQYRALSKPSRIIFTAGTAGQVALEHGGLVRGVDGAEHDNRTFGFAQLRENTPLPPGGIPHGVFTYELISVLSGLEDEGITLTALRERVWTRMDAVLEQMGLDGGMTPQLRTMGESTGEFVFVPRPVDGWLKWVGEAFDQRIKPTTTGAGVARASQAQIDQVLKQDASRDRYHADLARLRAKGWVVLAYRAAAAQAVGQADPDAAAADPVWRRRFADARRQASHGNADAMAALSYMYRHGLGTPADPAQANQWAGEAATSDSADAHVAWITSLQEDVGVDGTAAAEEARAAAQDYEASRKASTATAAVAAAGAVVALSGNKKQKKAGLAVAVGAGAASILERLKKKPKESLDQSIAQLETDITEVAALVARLDREGRTDLDAYQTLRGRIFNRVNRITALLHRRTELSHGRRQLTTLMRGSTKQLRRSVDELGGPLNRKRYELARDPLDRVETAYAELVALLPYLIDEQRW